jgi:hypothetical protein
MRYKYIQRHVMELMLGTERLFIPPTRASVVTHVDQRGTGSYSDRGCCLGAVSIDFS